MLNNYVANVCTLSGVIITGDLWIQHIISITMDDTNSTILLRDFANLTVINC